ncbi:MAG: DNA topoisomerase IB [Actinobacteria bacterium]|nr:MAG: DNA topoisomerase IB [Actinomycetota bacterium]TMK93765.1 MAG: DNA topoisomerase IB [Actinomycetota bacterium]
MTRLHRVRQSSPGFSRRRHGRGFVYLDQGGDPIRDERLERIRALAIPPAWTAVWICADDRGHLQATGTDDAGRRQYLYHPEWRRQRDREKFERIESFAEALPSLRARIDADLQRRGYPRERVLACAVRLLDRGLFRVGGEDYADNGSYGLATLRREHVVVGRDRAEFDFVGKGGKRHVREIRDPDVLRVLRTLCRRREADELLAWKEAEEWHDVRASDINAYLKDTSGGDFSAKDFRTWHATVLAATSLAEHGLATSGRAAKRTIREAANEVAEQLGNTAAVARSSYIDPRVVDRYLDGEVIDVLNVPAAEPGAAIEAAVLDLLRSHGDSGWSVAA